MVQKTLITEAVKNQLESELRGAVTRNVDQKLIMQYRIQIIVLDAMGDKLLKLSGITDGGKGLRKIPSRDHVYLISMIAYNYGTGKIQE